MSGIVYLGSVIMILQKLIALNSNIEAAIGNKNYKKLAKIILKIYPTIFREDYYGNLDFVFGIPPEDQSRAFIKLLKVIDDLGEKNFEYISTLQIEKINKMYERLADLSVDESDGWIFQQTETNIDINFWSKMPAWTADQAIIITIGKDPRYINGEYLNKWTVSVAGVLDSKDEEFIEHYVKIRDLVLCARDAGLLIFPVPSLVFIQWTKQFDIPFPQDLAAMVFSYNKEQDFESLYKASVIECQNLSDKNKVLEEKNKKLQQEKSDSKRSYNTVSKMFAGIVLEKFEDNASRTSEVKSALERQGVEVDVKTIREHQNRGFTLIRNFKEETL